MSRIPFETKKDTTTTRREAVFRVSMKDIGALVERQLRKQFDLDDDAEITISTVFRDDDDSFRGRGQVFEGFEATVVHEGDAAPVDDSDDDEDEEPRGPVSLDACRPGLFVFNGGLHFKTEYCSEAKENGEVVGWKCDAYCVASGEYFWGGTSDWRERGELIVQPVDYDDVVDLLGDLESA